MESITKTQDKKNTKLRHFSFQRQLCVSCFTFQRDTGAQSSPFLAAKLSYMFAKRHAAHRLDDRTTLICHTA